MTIYQVNMCIATSVPPRVRWLVTTAQQSTAPLMCSVINASWPALTRCMLALACGGRAAAAGRLAMPCPCVRELPGLDDRWPGRPSAARCSPDPCATHRASILQSKWHVLTDQLTLHDARGWQVKSQSMQHLEGCTNGEVQAVFLVLCHEPGLQVLVPGGSFLRGSTVEVLHQRPTGVIDSPGAWKAEMLWRRPRTTCEVHTPHCCDRPAGP